MCFEKGNVYSNGKTKITITEVDGSYVHGYNNDEKDRVFMVAQANMVIHFINNGFKFIGKESV